MAVSEISGIAGTVSGGGGASNQGFERFAEMMLRMREAKQQEAAQKLDTSFKIFDATGVMPSESDLKGPLKQLGVTLTPEMMDQMAQRGEQLRTTRSEAAKTQVAQRQAAEATAAGQKMDVQQQQAKLELGQRLSQAASEDDRMKILREGVDRGLISAKDMTDDEQFELTLQRIPAEQASPEKGVSMRDYMRDAHARHMAGLFSPDEIAKNKQDRVDQLARDKVAAEAEDRRLKVAERSATTAEQHAKIAQAQLELDRKKFKLDQDLGQAKMFQEKYSAIADYIKSDKQGAVEMMKAMLEAKKAGVEIPDSIKEQAMRGYARSLMSRGVLMDKDNNPIGVAEFQRLIESKEPKGLLDRLLGRKEQTFLFESLGKAGEDIEAAETGKKPEPPKSTSKRLGEFIGTTIGLGLPGSKTRADIIAATAKKFTEAGEAVGEAVSATGETIQEETGMPTPEDYMRRLIQVPRPVGR